MESALAWICPAAALQSNDALKQYRAFFNACLRGILFVMAFLGVPMFLLRPFWGGSYPFLKREL